MFPIYMSVKILSWDFSWILRALLDPIMKCLYIFRRILCWIFKIFTKNLTENSGVNTIYGRYRSKSTKNLTKNPD